MRYRPTRRLDRASIGRPVLLMGLLDRPDPEWARRMAAYDKLPPDRREALAESICDFNPCTVLQRLQARGHDYALALIAKSEAEARRDWNSQRGRVLGDSAASFGAFLRGLQPPPKN